MDEFSDGVLGLRLLCPTDALIMALADDEPAQRWLRRGRVLDFEGMLRLTRLSSSNWHTQADLRILGLVEVTTGLLVGSVQTCTHRSSPELAEGEVNIAYQVFPRHRGRGYGTRAALLACRMQRSLALGQVAVLTIHLDNAASLRVAHKAGFIPGGSMITDDGQWLAVFRRTIFFSEGSDSLCYDEDKPTSDTAVESVSHEPSSSRVYPRSSTPRF